MAHEELVQAIRELIRLLEADEVTFVVVWEKAAQRFQTQVGPPHTGLQASTFQVSGDLGRALGEAFLRQDVQVVTHVCQVLVSGLVRGRFGADFFRSFGGSGD